MCAYQCAGGVDPCVADCRVVKPFRLWEAEESVAGDVHGFGGKTVVDDWSYGVAGELRVPMTMGVFGETSDRHVQYTANIL